MTSCKQLTAPKKPFSNIQFGCLTLVSTPIGNLKDLTFRALETLQKADIIVCEDTRVTGKLLKAYDLNPSHLWTYHEHNGETQRPKLIEALTQGKNIALVSDAGTPLISDPGFKLVKAAQDKGIKVTASPGVSAVTTALSLAGLPTNSFYFGGFLPRKSGERQCLFNRLAPLPTTLIFYESARRVVASVENMLPFFQGREAVMARELTKCFEEIQRQPIEVLHQDLQKRPSLKGEVVLLVGPPLIQEASQEDLEHALEKALNTHTLKEAVALVSQTLNLPRKKVYKNALEIKEQKKSQE